LCIKNLNTNDLDILFIMNRECPKYFTEISPTNIISEERIKEKERIKEEERIQEDRIRNYLMFKSIIPEFYPPKREQKIGRAIRLTGKNISK
jgi:hypothetical protein